MAQGGRSFCRALTVLKALGSIELGRYLIFNSGPRVQGTVSKSWQKTRASELDIQKKYTLAYKGMQIIVDYEYAPTSLLIETTVAVLQYRIPITPGPKCK